MDSFLPQDVVSTRTGQLQFGRVDPMGRASTSPQRLNGYSYALNSPLGTTDPTGLDPEQGPIYTNGEYTVIGEYLPLTYLDPGGIAAVALYLQAMYDFGSEVDGWIVRHALRLFGLRREREIRASRPPKEPTRPEINETPHPPVDHDSDAGEDDPDDGGSGEEGGSDESSSCYEGAQGNIGPVAFSVTVESGSGNWYVGLGVSAPIGAPYGVTAYSGVPNRPYETLTGLSFSANVAIPFVVSGGLTLPFPHDGVYFTEEHTGFDYGLSGLATFQVYSSGFEAAEGCR